MNNSECKAVVHNSFSNRIFDKHIDNKALWVKGKNYRIQPDDAYYLGGEKIILFEYEYNKRPIESISKFWWLFRETDILNHIEKIKLLLITTNEDIGDIRNGSIEILGKELEKQYSDKFEFYFIPDDKVTSKAIEEMIEKMIG